MINRMMMMMMSIMMMPLMIMHNDGEKEEDHNDINQETDVEFDEIDEDEMKQ